MTEARDSAEYRCGFVAVVGRPNVGKSTLMNRLLGEKISIVSSKPQTTRHRIMGVHTTPGVQVVYVDTPGLHQREHRAINRYLNQAARNSLADVDCVLFVIDALKWTDEDEAVLQLLKGIQAPVVLVINKVDRAKNKNELLPFMESVVKGRDFSDVVPLSARSGENTDTLARLVEERMPAGPQMFPDDQITDRSERFLAAELVREQLMRLLGKEVPYATTVEVEAFEQTGNLRRISAVVWVERKGQKAIVIGENGELLKRVGSAARREMERLFHCRVYLKLWVKVREGWSDDERALRSLGYDEGP
ncbi:GTPase Era [Ectothiorhodospiraceae bacterium WFHF3C12]|nr:GTPase Era [Ectothiorhodospiraceae bacterium WFHF3C12]